MEPTASEHVHIRYARTVAFFRSGQNQQEDKSEKNAKYIYLPFNVDDYAKLWHVFDLFCALRINLILVFFAGSGCCFRWKRMGHAQKWTNSLCTSIWCWCWWNTSNSPANNTDKNHEMSPRCLRGSDGKSIFNLFSTLSSLTLIIDDDFENENRIKPEL
jgi:hypothetical protein